MDGGRADDDDLAALAAMFTVRADELDGDERDGCEEGAVRTAGVGKVQGNQVTRRDGRGTGGE